VAKKSSATKATVLDYKEAFFFTDVDILYRINTIELLRYKVFLGKAMAWRGVKLIRETQVMY